MEEEEDGWMDGWMGVLRVMRCATPSVHSHVSWEMLCEHFCDKACYPTS